jgi:hypothetical protein
MAADIKISSTSKKEPCQSIYQEGFLFTPITEHSFVTNSNNQEFKAFSFIRPGFTSHQKGLKA